MPRDNVFMNPLINVFMSDAEVSRWSVERRRKRERQLQRYLAFLKELIKLQGVNLKARDLTKVAGDVPHSTLIRFGLLLRRLEKLGLAKRWNRSRPVHYTLQPEWLWRSWSEICNYRCEADSSLCSLYGVCPYHRLLRLLAEKEREARGE